MDRVQGAVLSLRGIYETLAISAPTVLEGLFGRVRYEVCDMRLQRWAPILLDQADVRLDVDGYHHLDNHPDERFVVMSNHRALYDVPVLFKIMGARSFRMVVKEQLMRVPIWGDAMRNAGFVSVNRERRDKAIESLQKAREELDARTDIWIAPEGTRTRTGELLPFKKGGFHFALNTGRRILPIALIGTESVIPVNTYLVRPGAKVRARIGPPIDTASFAGNLDGLMSHVRIQIESMLS